MMRSFFHRNLSVVLFVFALGLCVVLAISQSSLLSAQDDDDANRPESIQALMAAMERDYQPAEDLAAMPMTPCVGGMAGSYPCQNVDLLSFMPLSTIGGGNGSANWGWTDPGSGREFAIMGRSNGTAFVEITDPVNPIYLGNLPSHTGTSSWRELKTYSHYVYIVSDNNGAHGMQVFNLNQLLTVTSPPVTFAESAHYAGVTTGHTITTNEATGYAYIHGSNTCSGGLHFVNIQNPLNPVSAGCFSTDGYTHDAQCLNYTGPDIAHQGKELCFAYNTDTLTIVDVTNKAAPVQISRTGYAGRGYTHQGWLTDDQQYLVMDDELDEQNFGHNSRTYLWDVRNLDAPVLMGYHQGPTPAVDHNQFFRGNYLFQANYRAGLRILNGSNIASGQLSEIAYFDIYPANNNANFNGAWHVYPYFPSGVVIVSGIEQGLFILQPNLAPGPTPTPTNTPGPTPSPTATNTPGPTTCTVYNSTNVPIGLPNGVASINSNLTVSGGGTIADVNFTVNMSHVWVGDLGMTLTNQGTGTSVNVLNRPGVPASTYGCSGDNIVATLDDKAALPVENQCADSTPTINGTFTPNNALSAFDGQNSNGTWVLTVNDYYTSADAGMLNSWSLQICTAGAGPTPTNTSVPPTATNTPVPPTPTNTPIPGGHNVIYASSSTSGTSGGVAFADEDILSYNTGTGVWSMIFDGSDVGLGSTDINAFSFLSDGSILLSFDSATFTVSGVGTVEDSDIVRFIPTSLGSTTSGTFQFYFDGSDVGLTTADEGIDAVDVTSDGKLIISTIGAFSVTGASGQDEDLAIFTPTALGSTTSGTWALHFDGSDVGLSTSSNEDVNGAWTAPNGNVYLTTLGAFSVTGVSGDGADIFICVPGSLGSTTTCTFSMYWDGSANGYAGEVLDAFAVVQP